MLVLGIETSCDETAVAVVDDRWRILANKIFSQIEEHTAFGGVVPEIAARAHLDHLGGLVEQALAEANCTLVEVDAIAATAGPGLIGGLIVGVTFAKTLAAATGKPFIAVNHLEAHALTARLTDDVAFPYLLLLVSGGHTQLLLVEAVGQYRRLGGTIDDAAGEAFDKLAKLLGLGFPGGPALEKAAISGDAKRFTLPQPLAGRPGCDFSFSGLKTAARQLIEKLPQPLGQQDQADMAASFQAGIAGSLASRTARAIAMAKVIYPALSTLVVAGGVAANQAVRAALTSEAQQAGLHMLAPPAALCTDNAAMVAWGWTGALSSRPAGWAGFCTPAPLAVDRAGGRMIGIIGTGAWGTALAISGASTGTDVVLIARDATSAAKIQADRENAHRLPGITLPTNLQVTADWAALREASLILLVVPAQTLRSVLQAHRQFLPSHCPLVICAKGLEKQTGQTMAEIVAEEAPGHPIALLSGPNFAIEVAQGLPTAATLACTDPVLGAELARQLSHRGFRVYASTDIAGVALGGALKNVIAIACGIVAGRGLGENARAALLTRGLAEITRLANRLGAQPETLMGLAGLGDLALCCSSLQSRNYAFGYHLGQGMEKVAAAGGNLAEGAATAEAVLTLAAHYDLEMPIAGAVQAILSGSLPIETAIEALMLRPLKVEGV